VWEFELAPMWSASIEISSNEAGSWLTDVDSVITVTDDRERASTYALPARTITVLEPLPPTAFFYLDPTQPQVGVEAKLDASGSVVYQDGEIELYAWDLNGDGIVDLSGDDATITYLFPDEGEFEIALTVYDSAGRSGSFERTVEILPSVSVTRTIETCLPDDETIENARVEVSVEIHANTTIHGLTLREELPAGWTIELGENSHATARKDDAAAVVDWLFLETLNAGDYRLITYTLIAPAGNFASEIEEGQMGARDQVTINGQIASSSPRLSEAVLGEDKIVRLQYLSVPVAITHWDSVAGKVEVCLPGEIAFDQIQYAVSLWVSGDTVPNTNQSIDLAMIRDLIAYWLTDTSVYEPLPE
jgi:PKD repeat protein